MNTNLAFRTLKGSKIMTFFQHKERNKKIWNNIRGQDSMINHILVDDNSANELRM